VEFLILKTDETLSDIEKHYREKDENGKLVNNVFDDLEKLNTDDKGNCKCIQCGKIFVYKTTDVNICKKCMRDMF
jgi:hypothetical protein